MANQFGSKAALNSPPHVTLHMPFQYRKDREVRIVEAVQKIQLPSFLVNHKGFGAFEPRVIFVNVDDSNSLHALRNQTVKICRSNLNLENADYRNQGFHPHMTIAFRDLKKSMFLEAWNIYEKQTFLAEWECNSLWLLKHNGQSWDAYREIFFSTLSSNHPII